MHSSLSIVIWATSLLAANIAASAHPVPSFPPRSATSPLIIKFDQIDAALTHATFNLTCRNCLRSSSSSSLFDHLELPFDLAVLPGEDLCKSTLSLNAATLVSLAPEISNPWPTTGSSIVKASDHDIGIDWFATCVKLEDRSSPPQTLATRVVSVKLKSVDGHDFENLSDIGFTLSFKENIPPEFLRLASAYTEPSTIDDSWTNPPANLRISGDTQEADDLELRSHLEDLHYLQAEVELIQELIAEKKRLIASRLSQDLKASIARCDGVLCYVETVFSHAHKSVSTLYHNHKPNPYTSSLDPQGFVLKGAARQSTMAAAVQNQALPIHQDGPSAPEKCHCKEGNVNGGWPELPERPSTERSSQRNGTSSTSNLSVVLESFFVLTGLAFLFSCFRNCCRSRRKKRLSHPQRARVTVNRGRKRGFWAWVSRKKAEKRAEGISQTYRNIDEKRTRVVEQETVLEGFMQAEIQQLEIHEELLRLQNTRNEVDELIRAEEGRHVAAPPYSSNPFDPSRHARSTLITRQVGLDRHSVPQPINIPSRHQTSPDNNHQCHPQPLLSSSAHSYNPFSPISRTTSLPSYRSKPPSYQGDGESSYAFSDSDEMTDNEGDQDHWTVSDDSSLPDLSPRPSGETLGTHFTGETARTFL